MTQLFTVGSCGTALSLIETERFSDWLEAQSSTTKTWVKSSGYEGKGLSLIPGAEGQLSHVVYGVENLNDHFACGDLVNLLPEGNYRPIAVGETVLKRLAFSWGIGAYRFTRYNHRQKKANNNKNLPTLMLPSADLKIHIEREVSAVTLIRDLINTPAQDMMPEHLGATVECLASQFGGEVHQLVGTELLEHNYPTIHAVGRASEHAPRLIDLRWGDESHPKITLVGKGVCFDSGGLNIKTTSGIRHMKKDMAGAANAIGLAQLIMAHQLPVRLRLLVPAVENAISNNAYHPGDVITTRKGISVEINNTDSEGRLVLCDALTEADRESPDLLIDFATLTGSCRVALGTELPGFFSNNKARAQDLIRAGEAVDDPLWQLPLYQPYKTELNSDIADMANSGSALGGAIIAALYLQEFISPDTDWLHVDFMAWNTRVLPGRPVGGEAVGIRAVFSYLSQTYV
ncbi:leucyl aminopeptidase family protein [Porticoccaceae bacterium]|nr:leucyl aminopeptidase family protein [Porticoccaceae bacterium]